MEDMMRIACQLVAMASCGLVVGFASDAAASPVTMHGNNCYGIDSTHESRLTRTQWGIANSSAETASIVCPLDNFTAAGEPSSFLAIVYDRNSTSDVVCSFYKLTLGGALASSSSPNTQQ